MSDYMDKNELIMPEEMARKDDLWDAIKIEPLPCGGFKIVTTVQSEVHLTKGILDDANAFNGRSSPGREIAGLHAERVMIDLQELAGVMMYKIDDHLKNPGSQQKEVRS